MKKVIYFLFVILLVLVAWKMYDNFRKDENVDDKAVVSEVVNRVFELEGINKSECIIEGYYFYGSNYLSEDGSRELLDYIASGLGVNTKYEYTRERTDNGYINILRKEGELSTLEMKLITVEIEESMNVLSQKQYLTIYLEIDNSINSAFYYYNNIADIMKKVLSDNKSNNLEYNEKKLNNNLTISVKGSIRGDISIEEQKRISKDLLKEFGAKKIFDSINESDDESKREIYSLYGYSNNIEDYVGIGNEKINVNIAFNYDENNRETIMHIGSPIVNYDY